MGGHRPTGDKAGNADLAHRRFRAAGNHHVRVAVLNESHGVPDRMGAGRAGGHNRVIRPLEVVPDRDLARGEVDQRRWNEEWAYPPRSLLFEFNRGIGDGRQAANSRADVHAGTPLTFFILRRPARIGDRLVGR